MAPQTTLQKNKKLAKIKVTYTSKLFWKLCYNWVSEGVRLVENNNKMQKLLL